MIERAAGAGLTTQDGDRKAEHKIRIGEDEDAVGDGTLNDAGSEYDNSAVLQEETPDCSLRLRVEPPKDPTSLTRIGRYHQAPRMLAFGTTIIPARAKPAQSTLITRAARERPRYRLARRHRASPITDRGQPAS
jgi:hypothetical protein